MYANPLTEFHTYRAAHYMVAFQYGEDASKISLDDTIGAPGEILRRPGMCGIGVVIANEKYAGLTRISKLDVLYEYNSPMHATTTVTTGVVEFYDRADSFFSNFMRGVADTLDMSLNHVTFSLSTHFTGTPKNPMSADTLVCKPLIFHITDLIEDAVTRTGFRTYSMHFILDYNTFGQMPNFTTVPRITVTHSDGIGDSGIDISGDSSGRILSHAEKNARYSAPRQQRESTNKPMKNLKELFDGLNASVNAKTVKYGRDLQSWLGAIDESRQDVIVSVDPPEDRKKLPFDYTVELDDVYKSYVIDNRSLMFEQPEQSQPAIGVRSMTLPINTTIFDAVSEFMTLSNRVAADVDGGKSFRTNMCVYRACDGNYKLNFSIKRVNKPVNTISDDNNNNDTGINAESVVTPLTYEFDKSGSKDVEILTLSVLQSQNMEYDFFEKENDTSEEARVVGGDREQVVFERTPSKPFFKTGFSGFQVPTTPNYYTSESGINAAKVKYDNESQFNVQKSVVRMLVRGNPDILSDIARNPLKVARGDEDNPTLFRFPEHLPLYAKALVYLRTQPLSFQTHRDNEVDPLPVQYFYDGTYHIRSIHSRISASEFTQEIVMLRTDDKT